MIKSILIRLFVIYALLLFVATLIPVYLFLRLYTWLGGKKRGSVMAYHVYKIWMGIYMPAIGCPVTIKGKEKLEKGIPYIFIFNHSSLMDIPVSTPGLPAPNKTLAKSDFLKVPIFGFIYELCSITINRKDLKSRAGSFALMEEALQQGFHLGLYPEGTRNTSNNRLLPFQDGAFKLAVKTHTPIVIAIMRGTKNIIHPTKKLYVTPRRIVLEFLEVVPTHTLSEDDSKTLKQYCYDVMEKAL